MVYERLRRRAFEEKRSVAALIRDRIEWAFAFDPDFQSAGFKLFE